MTKMLLYKQVKINFKDNKNNWYPEELMEVNLIAEENSLVCLIGGRGTETVSPLRSVLNYFSVKYISYSNINHII